MPITVTANYTTENNKLYRTPVYRATFARSGRKYSTHPLAGSLDYMQLSSSIAAEITPQEGRSTIGSITIILEDVSGEITDLIGEGIGGDTVTFEAGFADIAIADYAVFFTGLVENFKLTSDLTAYEITVRDPQSLVNKQIFETAVGALTAVLAGAAADTFVHMVLAPGSSVAVPFTNQLNNAAMTTVLDNAWGVGNYTIVSTTATVGSTITIGSTSFFKSSGYVLVDQEVIAYTGKTATTFTGLTRASKGSTISTHVVGARVEELLVFGPKHPMDILLDVYQNTDKTGLGIAASLIDTAQIAVVKTAIGTYEMEFRVRGHVNAKEWLENEIFKPLACYPRTTGAGKLSITRYAEPVSSAVVDTIDHDCIVSDDDGAPILTWDGNFDSLINDVTFKYDQDVNLDFQASLNFTDQLSITTFGRRPLVISSNGFRSSLTGTTTLITALASQILLRYRIGAPAVTARCFLQKNLLQAGDIVQVTSVLLPNRFTKARGVTSTMFEVTNRTIDFRSGYADMELLWTSFQDLARDDFSRANTVSLDLDRPSQWYASYLAPSLISINSDSLALLGHGFLWHVQTFGDDQISELAYFSSGGGFSGPAVRQNKAGTYANYTGYAALYDVDNTRIQLRKYVGVDLTAATGTQLGSNYAVTLVAGDRVRIHVIGTTLNVYLNDVLIIGPITDAAITGGSVGAVTNEGAGASLKWRNWRGGDSGWA